MAHVSHIDRRKIEAEMIGRIYGELCADLDRPTALGIVTRAVEKAAAKEGRRFAGQASGAPSLAHFKTVLANWDEALQIQIVEDTDDVLRFDVTRCDYIRAYESMGLPPELVTLLSCRRDAAFAKGYSEQIEFSRSNTLAEGHALCDFCYRWVTD